METDQVIQMLNRARAEELACVQLYAQDARMLEEMGNRYLARLFREQLAEEVMHARWLAARVRELGGTPTDQPSAWCRKRGARRGIARVRGMLHEAAALERKELAQYERGILDCALAGDLQTKTLLEQIVGSEESHQGLWLGLLSGRD